MQKALQFQQYMYIDSPNFVRRRVVNSDRQGNHQNKSDFYDFGKERQQLLNHVTSALLHHQHHDQILEKFRKEAEELKKQKYQSKRHPRNDSPPFNIQEQVIKESPQIPKVGSQQVMKTPEAIKNSDRPAELQVVLRHSNDLVEKYRKILNIKEKQLKRKDRKLQHSKLALQRMSLKVKQLERERVLADRQEEVEMSKIEQTLRQMGTHLSQNKTTVAQQISALKQEFSHSEDELPNISEFNSNHSKLKENNPIQVKPNHGQLENIKRKARSLKYKTLVKNPSIFYTKLSTEKSQGQLTPKNRDSLDVVNKSIVHQSRFRALSGADPQPILF